MNRYKIGKSYLQVATQTASPANLVLMLYDGAIRFLERALEGFSEDDPCEFNETINNNLQRTQAILDELNASLDLERGGELADRLRQIYHYLDRRIQESNLRKDPDGVSEAITRITLLRDAWREMMSQSGAGREAAPANRLAFAAFG